MNSFLKEKRILVTGACGTVGRELARQLLEDYKIAELVLMDNNESELFFLEQVFSNPPISRRSGSPLPAKKNVHPCCERNSK